MLKPPHFFYASTARGGKGGRVGGGWREDKYDCFVNQPLYSVRVGQLTGCLGNLNFTVECQKKLCLIKMYKIGIQSLDICVAYACSTSKPEMRGMKTTVV